MASHCPQILDRSFNYALVLEAITMSEDRPEHELEHESEDAHSAQSQSPDGEAAEATEPATEAPSQRDQELSKLKEALLRTQADMHNLEKRTQRDLEKARKFMFEGLMRDLVPVIDSLDQALEASEQAEDEGLVLVRKLLLDSLGRYGLAAIEAEGQKFDPEWHEAMSMQPSAEHDPNTVLMVLQTGYRLHDRLIRPARVIISSEAADG